MPIIILLLDRGYKPTTIAKMLSVPISRVYYANKKYKHDVVTLKNLLDIQARKTIDAQMQIESVKELAKTSD